MSKVGDVLSKLTSTQTSPIHGSGGGVPSHQRLCGSEGFAPSRWASFCNFLEKKPILMPLDHILRVFNAIERTRFLTLESQFKKSNYSILLFLAMYVQKMFKILHLVLNLVSDSAQVRGSKAHCLLQYFGSK